MQICPEETGLCPGTFSPTNGMNSLAAPSRNSSPPTKIQPRGVAATRPGPQLAGTVPAAGPRCLVLDDDPVFAGLMGEMLSILGCQSVICHHPVDALEIAGQRDFDLIVCDYRLPVMNGCQFYTRCIVTRPELAFRFLFVTGEAGNPSALQFMSGAGLVCLIKPITFSMLKAKIQQVLAQAEARSGSLDLKVSRAAPA